MTRTSRSSTQGVAPAERVLVVGDGIGVPRLLGHLPDRLLCGVLAAGIRPQYHSALAVIAADREVAFMVQPRVASPEYSRFVHSVTELAPDLILCDSYSMLLRPDILSVPRAGAVNVHGGLLPQYRGGNPIQWTIINDEAQAGATIHYMDEGFDSGFLIAQRQVPVLFTDTWRDVMRRIDVATNELLSEHTPAILSGRATAIPQDPTQACYYRHRRPADGSIDWSQSIRAIYNLIRALVAPLPGAFYGPCGAPVVVGDYLTIAEVAALKQEMIGGQWPGPEASALCVDRTSSHERVLLEVLDAGGDQIGKAELHGIDYRARTSTFRWTPVEPLRFRHAQALESVLEFARRELGIVKFETESGVERLPIE